MNRLNKFFLFGLFSILMLLACGKEEHTEQDDSNTANKITDVKKSSDAENSIYQFNGEWTNSQNEKMKLKDLEGKVQLVAMVFTHCGFACPRMIDNIKQVEKELPGKIKDKIGFVLVTFDVERDTPEKLRKYASEKHLDSHWTLLHGDEEQVRTLSMLLDVQYNELSGGMFNHSNILTILDQYGNISKQFEGLDINSKEVLNVIEQLN